MHRHRDREEDLLGKLLTLPPEKFSEVEDFIDFLRARQDDRLIVASAGRLSEDALRRVWDNPDDAEYDRL